MKDPLTTPPEILMPGDIILTRGYGLLDFLIRWGQALARRRWRPSSFSHSAICTGPWTIMDADPGERVGTRFLGKWLHGVKLDTGTVFQPPSSIWRGQIDAVAANISDTEGADANAPAETGAVGLNAIALTRPAGNDHRPFEGEKRATC